MLALRRCVHALAVCLAVAACTPQAASAAPPWSDPVAIGSADEMYGQGIAFAADGSALLYWRFFQTSPSAEGYRLAWRDPAGRIVREQSLPYALAAAPVRVSADTFALLRLAEVGRAKNGLPRVRLTIGFIRVGGAAGPFRKLATFVQPTDAIGGPIPPVIAVVRDGAVAIAWTELSARKTAGGGFTGTERLRLAIHRAGHRFDRARTVARRRLGGLGPVALSAGPHGQLLIAFAAHRGSHDAAATLARLRSRTGRLGPALRVGPADPSWGIDLRAVVGSEGTLAVAWGSRTAEECYPTGAKRVYAAVRPTGVQTFRPVRRLGKGTTSCESRKIGVVVRPDGTTVVAWSQLDDRLTRSVRVAELDARGRVASNDRLGGGDFGGLAIRRDGAIIVTWDDGPDPLGWNESPGFGQGLEGWTRGHALAALQPPGSNVFGESELVSAEHEDAAPPAAAFDTAGRPVLVWWSRRVTGDPPTAVDRSATLSTAVRAVR